MTALPRRQATQPHTLATLEKQEMLNRKWSITLALVTVTAVVAALSALTLQPGRALAQTAADCQILWTTDDDYQRLASGTTNLVAQGYAVSGFTASEDYLYTLACRK